MTERIALILGLTGAIGGATAAALAREGWRIRALGRRAPVLPFAVDWRVGDAMDAWAVAAAAQGVEVIFHGVNPPGYRRWRELAIPMLANTIAAARSSGARILFPGNVYVFSPAAGAVVDEAAPQTPATRKGRVRAEMEAMLAEAARQGVASLILRAGDFFGPGVPGSWFSQAVAKGGRHATVLQDPGTPGVGHAWAYVPDLAQAFAELAARPDLNAFEAFHFQGHWMDPGEALLNATKRALGREVKIRRFPWLLVWLGAPFVTFLREALEMRWLWRQPLRLDNARLVARLGREPHTDIDSALRATLA